MFLSREIDLKLCQIYTEISIYAINQIFSDYKNCKYDLIKEEIGWKIFYSIFQTLQWKVSLKQKNKF